MSLIKRISGKVRESAVSEVGTKTGIVLKNLPAGGKIIVRRVDTLVTVTGINEHGAVIAEYKVDGMNDFGWNMTKSIIKAMQATASRFKFNYFNSSVSIDFPKGVTV